MRYPLRKARFAYAWLDWKYGVYSVSSKGLHTDFVGVNYLRILAGVISRQLVMHVNCLPGIYSISQVLYYYILDLQTDISIFFKKSYELILYF